MCSWKNCSTIQQFWAGAVGGSFKAMSGQQLHLHPRLLVFVLCNFESVANIC